MASIDTPIVLVTRPMEGAQAFVDRLRTVAGPFEAVISPAFAFHAMAHSVPKFGAAIFTSKAGVEFAPEGAGRTAFCVGDATAALAQSRGYVAVSAGGDADDLVKMILAQGPAESLLHLRGETSRGNVRTRLVEGGLTCDEVVTYRKAPMRPDPSLTVVMTAVRTVLIPLFSAQTVSILAGWNLDLEAASVIAISDEVADAARALSPAETIVADRPNLEAMTQATARLIA